MLFRRLVGEQRSTKPVRKRTGSSARAVEGPTRGPDTAMVQRLPGESASRPVFGCCPERCGFRSAGRRRHPSYSYRTTFLHPCSRFPRFLAAGDLPRNRRDRAAIVLIEWKRRATWPAVLLGAAIPWPVRRGRKVLRGEPNNVLGALWRSGWTAVQHGHRPLGWRRAMLGQPS